VERVETGGPADRVGIKAGDVLLEADGRKIRSAYQAIDLILRKQPGDRVPLVIEQSGASKELTMTLSGTPATALSYNHADATLQVGPQVNVRMVSPNEVEVRRGPQPAERGIAEGARLAGDEVSMLKTQMARLQEELRRRDKLIESMNEEIARLRKGLEKQ
jgi:hypothetical protein